MGIFNQQSVNPQRGVGSTLRGLQGAPGVGFSLTKDGNYDISNKKLKNVFVFHGFIPSFNNT